MLQLHSGMNQEKYILPIQILLLFVLRLCSLTFLTLFQLFMDGSNLLGKGSPPGFLLKLKNIAERLTRLLFCYDTEIINKVTLLQQQLLQITIIVRFICLLFVSNPFFPSYHDYDNTSILLW